MVLPIDLEFNVMNFFFDFRSFFVSKESDWVEFLEFGFGVLVFQRVQISISEIDLVNELFFSDKLVRFFHLSLDIITLFHNFWFGLVKKWQRIFN